MKGRRMTWDERFDELEELGRHIWEALPAERREQHQIDRQKLSQGAQCHCTCGAACVAWVGHLIDVREHAELWNRLEAQRLHPVRVLLGAGQFEPAEVGGCCGHEYRRHLIGLDGCASCEQFEPEHARCAGWRRQLPGVTS